MSLEGVIRSNGKGAKKAPAKKPTAKPAVKTVAKTVAKTVDSASKPESKTTVKEAFDKSSAVTGQKIYSVTDELPVYLL